ncbi:hypothetical protein ACHAWF_012685 [Thalassiosira exigua]
MIAAPPSASSAAADVDATTSKDAPPPAPTDGTGKAAAASDFPPPRPFAVEEDEQHPASSSALHAASCSEAPFADVARAAARAMEHVDMDRLFEEMMSGGGAEELEEAAAAVAAGGGGGGLIGAAELAALNSPKLTAAALNSPEATSAPAPFSLGANHFSLSSSAPQILKSSGGGQILKSSSADGATGISAAWTSFAPSSSAPSSALAAGGGIVSPMAHQAPQVQAAVLHASTGGAVTDCASSISTEEGSVPRTVMVPQDQGIASLPKAPDAASLGSPECKSLKPRTNFASATYAYAQVQAAHGSQVQPVQHYPPQQQQQQQQQNPYQQQGYYQMPPNAAAAGSSSAHFSNPGHPDACAQAAKRQRAAFGAVPTAQVASRPAPRQPDHLRCARCCYPAPDVAVRCPCGCAYHARCLDLVALCRDPRNAAPQANGNFDNEGQREVDVRVCPACARPANGMEILPLKFDEMDRVQRSVQEGARAAFLSAGMVHGRPVSSANGAVGAGAGGAGSNGVNGAANAGGSPPGAAGIAGTKRPFDPSQLPQGCPTSVPAHSGSAGPLRKSVQCYDPHRPRTGRWTDEEIAFRDALIARFLEGSLPLGDGLKLNDFLPSMLKSKQSRLAKKMKHAKLSTKYFYPKAGCVNVAEGGELSRLEASFVASVPDPVERSEIAFHMGREWREHLARRLHSLSINFDGRAWLGSVEDMERRLAYEKERHRLAKRRFMMGKAMERDCSKLERGVFVSDPGPRDSKDEFELVVEKSIGNSAGRRPSGGASHMVPSAGGNKEEAREGTRSATWSSSDPNFRHAAPFLAGISSYVERNAVPFEHVDIWVPSCVDPGDDATSKSGGSTSSPGGSQGNFRLRFGGSVTMGVQIVRDEVDLDASEGRAYPAPVAGSPHSPTKRVPLGAEEKSHLALFGSYSEKFSFSPGCGLPGRIFESGVPTWEQFVSEAHPSLFERRGGAMQFGVKTAVGLPVDSPNVGRVVLVLYSRHDRPKDEALVGRMMADLRLLCPCPRWKLVVDVDGPSGQGAAPGASSSLQAPPPAAAAGPAVLAPAASRADPKEQQIRDLILLLGENIPSDAATNSPRLQGIMNLRLVLLRGTARIPQQEGLVDIVLVLFESYLKAGRSREDIAAMIVRDFAFHVGHQPSAAPAAAAPSMAPAAPSLSPSASLAPQVQAPVQARPPSMYHPAARAPTAPQGINPSAAYAGPANAMAGAMGNYVAVQNFQARNSAAMAPMAAGAMYSPAMAAAMANPQGPFPAHYGAHVLPQAQMPPSQQQAYAPASFMPFLTRQNGGSKASLAGSLAGSASSR